MKIFSSAECALWNFSIEIVMTTSTNNNLPSLMYMRMVMSCTRASPQAWTTSCGRLFKNDMKFQSCLARFGE
jgi:hypothetical protein